MRLLELFDRPAVDISWDNEYNTDIAEFSIGKHKYAVTFDSQDDDGLYDNIFDGEWFDVPDEIKKVIDTTPNMVDVEFMLVAGYDGRIDITNTGNQYKVFSTVLSIINEFIDKHNIDFITLQAKEANRVQLYKRLIKRFAGNKKKWGFKSRDGAYSWIIKT